MSLKLLKPGTKTKIGYASAATGWGNILSKELNAADPYFTGNGLTLVTVTAWGCDGLQIHHWGGDGYIQAATSGKNHTVSGIMDLTSKNLVVKALNPTDNTKVIVNMQTLSLSLSLVNALACYARRWRYGAKESRPRDGDREWYRLVSTKDRPCGGVTHRGAGHTAVISRAVRAHSADLRSCVRPILHQLVHAPREHQFGRCPHPAGLHRQGIRSNHLHRLATVGGGV